MKSWFEARAASRRTPADLIARGNEARDARLWADAAEAYKAALDLDPSLDAIWVQLGHALIARGNEARDARLWADAAEAFKAALDLDPSLDAIWVQLGHAQKEQGDLQSAEQCYRRALSLNPSSADTFLQLGHCLKLMGRIGLAVDAYMEAVARDPENADARIELEALSPSFAAQRPPVVDGKLGMQDVTAIRSMMLALRASGAEGYELFHDPVFRPRPKIVEVG